MGTETRLERDGYGFDGPRKRNFRRALNRAACCGYTIAERSVNSREMTFLTRPAVLDDEVDVRKFFAFDPNGSLRAFAFSDPIYAGGEVVGYLCSAKRRLPEADTLVGYAILYRAIRVFQGEGKAILSLGLSPLCGVEDKELSSNQGIAAHKGAFFGSAEQTYCAFKRGLTLSQVVKMPRACNLV